MPDLAEGHRIGPYRIVRLLGEGGMGLVYEAVREDLGGRVALKVLRVEYALKPEFAARFFNEARAANVIEHPGVARVFDYGQLPGGVAYLTMEYLDGESLAKRQERLGRLATDEVLRIGRQIASAVAAAHAKQIIHRDLKPDNIMLVPDVESQGGDRVKVLDFGIAKLAGELYGSARTKTNVLLGTPIYMAPEQCRGAKGVGEKTDVYSLGVILYEMLAGRPPFVGEEPGEYIGMHMFKEPPPLQQFAPKVPVRLLSLVHAMLTKTYEQRPDMSRVAQELRQLAQVNSESMPAFKLPREILEEEDNNLTISIIKKSAAKKPPINDLFPTVRGPVPAPLVLRPQDAPPPSLPLGIDQTSSEKPAQQNPKPQAGRNLGLPKESDQPVSVLLDSTRKAPARPAPAHPASTPTPLLLDGPTEVDTGVTFLQLSTPPIVAPTTRNSGTPERQTAKSLDTSPKWLHWIIKYWSEGYSRLQSVGGAARNWLKLGHAGSARATKVVWSQRSSRLVGALLALLALGIAGLILVASARRPAPPVNEPAAPSPVPPKSDPPKIEPTEITDPRVTAPLVEGLSSPKKSPGAKSNAKPTGRLSSKEKSFPSPWSAQDVNRALALARAKASQGDISGALTTAHHAAEFGNEPAAWAMVGVYACTIRSGRKANEALSQLSKKPGSSDLLSSMLAACRSQGFNRSADGPLTSTIH